MDSAQTSNPTRRNGREAYFAALPGLLPWRGDHVAVDTADRAPYWYACVACGQSLTDTASRELGYDPICQELVAYPTLRKYRLEALARDRGRLFAALLCVRAPWP